MEAWLRELASGEKVANEAPAGESESASGGEPERQPSADDDDWSEFPSARAANLTFLGRADEIFVQPDSLDRLTRPSRMRGASTRLGWRSI